MADPLVREWLADSKALSPTEAHSFACTIAENLELIHGIFGVLEDRNKHNELLENICNQLFTFYRSRDVELQRFSLQYLPAMIGVYLCSLAHGDKKNVKCVEVLLLGVYNLEVVDSFGKAKVHSFRLPCVAQPSIYHAPISLASSALTENALSRLEKGDSHIVAIGPFPQVENINAQNRMKVMTVLMNLYNRNVSFMSKPSLLALCKMCSRLTKQGFGKPGSYYRASYGSDSLVGNPYVRPPPRIPLTHSFLLEVLHSVYYSMFNGLGAVGLQALDDAHLRASHDLLADVLLVTNAIRNSLHTNPSGQPNDGPMGISISLSPTTSMTTVSKSIITNASFRTKKLPDDIPIQKVKDGESAEGQKSLTTISEEADDMEKQQPKSKDKEKAMAPLIGMISKISEKTKIGKKSEDQQTGNKGSKMGSAGNLVGICSNVSDGKIKKDTESLNVTKSSWKDAEVGSGGANKGGGFHNGETATVATRDVLRTEAVVKNQPTTQVVDTIEMKVVNSSLGNDSINLSESEGAFENHSDEGGSLSSNNSTSEGEKQSFQSSSQKSESDGISMSRSEIHTLV